MQPQKLLSGSLRFTAFFICIGFALQTSAQNKLPLVGGNHLGVNDTVIVEACIEPNGDTIPCHGLKMSM